jgi:hypothetical protein
MGRLYCQEGYHTCAHCRDDFYHCHTRKDCQRSRRGKRGRDQ